MSEIIEEVIMMKIAISRYPNGQKYVKTTAWFMEQRTKNTTKKKKKKIIEKLNFNTEIEEENII